MSSHALSPPLWGQQPRAQEKRTISLESCTCHLRVEESEYEHEHTSTSEDDLLELLGMLDDTRTWTSFDKAAKTDRTTSSSGRLWENVMARVTIDDKTVHIMSLEHTKHMNEKDFYRNLPLVRGIRTFLLDCSLLSPDQRPKQSFQTFPALQTKHVRPQTQQVLKDDSSDGSDHPVMMAKELFKSAILSAVRLDGAVIGASLYHTTHTISFNIKFHRIQVNIPTLFFWLVE